MRLPLFVQSSRTNSSAHPSRLSCRIRTELNPKRRGQGKNVGHVPFCTGCTPHATPLTLSYYTNMLGALRVDLSGTFWYLLAFQSDQNAGRASQCVFPVNTFLGHLHSVAEDSTDKNAVIKTTRSTTVFYTER